MRPLPRPRREGLAGLALRHRAAELAESRDPLSQQKEALADLAAAETVPRHGCFGVCRAMLGCIAAGRVSRSDAVRNLTAIVNGVADY